jgi:hypothetical protein
MQLHSFYFSKAFKPVFKSKWLAQKLAFSKAFVLNTKLFEE